MAPPLCPNSHGACTSSVLRGARSWNSLNGAKPSLQTTLLAVSSTPPSSTFSRTAWAPKGSLGLEDPTSCLSAQCKACCVVPDPWCSHNLCETLKNLDADQRQGQLYNELLYLCKLSCIFFGTYKSVWSWGGKKSDNHGKKKNIKTLRSRTAIMLKYNLKIFIYLPLRTNKLI